MADSPVGYLPQAAVINDDDLFVLEQEGTAKKLTGYLLTNYIDRRLVNVNVIQLEPDQTAYAQYNRVTGDLVLYVPRGNGISNIYNTIEDVPEDYDIIFIDHMMPELDGIDTLNMIRSDPSEYMKKVPLIALTANVVSGVREMFISEGFDDYVPKPIDMVWLNAILRKYLPAEKQR